MIKKHILRIMNITFLLIFIVLSKSVNATEEVTLKNTTRAYFCAGVTSGTGDLILLENYDKDGKKSFGLIDAGNYKTRDANELIVEKEDESEDVNLEEYVFNDESNENVDNSEEESEIGSEEDNPDNITEDDSDEMDDDVSEVDEIEDDEEDVNYDEIISEGKYNVALKYLMDHGVTKENGLDFFIITHQHIDHHGNALAIIEYLEGNIGTIYMKETDNEWVSGLLAETNTVRYYNIIKAAIKYNIKVVGTSYYSLKSPVISPTMFSDKFKDEKVGNNAKIENFKGFTEKNIRFKFGSSTIQLFNWEIFDTEGNVISIDDENRKIIKNGVSYNITKENYNREKCTSGENGHSLGILLTQGNKRGFFAGDINNSDTGIKIGDEDRIKDSIGDVDFLKPGHHGYGGSNSKSYLETLQAEYMIITNKTGGAAKGLQDYVQENNVHCVYCTEDSEGVVATFSDNDVYIGFETPGEMKIINDKRYYIPKNYLKYDDYTNYLFNLKYEDTQYINKENGNSYVSSWKELAQCVNNNYTEVKEIMESENTINYDDKTITIPKIIIELKNSGSWTANSKCKIRDFQNISLTSNEQIKIIRNATVDKIYKGNLFYLTGILTLGANITLDGNKDNIDVNTVDGTESIIYVEGGTLYLYGSVCNNKVQKIGPLKSRHANLTGAGINCDRNGVLNIYEGAVISDNILRLASTYSIPSTSKKEIKIGVTGAGIYLNNTSTLNMYGGSIYNNKAINRLELKDKETINYNNIANINCTGAGIYIGDSSNANIYDGKIYNNQAYNYSKLTLENNNSKIKELRNRIYGSGIAVENAKLNIKKKTKDIKIYDNTSRFNNTITLKNGASMKNTPKYGTLGGQVYCNNSDITINGATIYNNDVTKKSITTNPKIEVSTLDCGGGICFQKRVKFNLKNVKINNCKDKGNGGGLYMQNACTGVISSSTLSENSSYQGGAIYNEPNCELRLYNTAIQENTATQYGGGIYNRGITAIYGNQSKINNNTSTKSGGGIVNSSGAICALSNGNVKSNNTTSGQGGGIYNLKGTLYKSDSVSVSNNTAPNGTQEGKEIYPNDNSQKDTSNPTASFVGIPNKYKRDKIDLTINTNDNAGIKSISINGKTLSSYRYLKDSNGKYYKKYDYEISENGTYNVIINDYAGNKFERSITIDKIVISGDVNSDNKVDINDIFVMNKYRLKKTTLDEKAKTAGDLNNDGKVDIKDILKVNKIRLGK